MKPVPVAQVGQAVDGVIAALESFAGQPAKGGAWTAVQTLDHLIQVHRGVVLGLRAKEPLPRRAPFFLVRRTMVGFVLRNAIPVPAKGAQLSCPAEADFASMAGDLQKLQTKLELRASEGIPPDQLVMNHPVAGPLNFDETMAIVHAHLVYHIKRAGK
jgi:hypothetical protein